MNEAANARKDYLYAFTFERVVRAAPDSHSPPPSLLPRQPTYARPRAQYQHPATSATCRGGTLPVPRFGFTNGGTLVAAFSSTTRDSALLPLHTMIKARVPCRQPRRQNLPCWVVIGSFFLRMLAGLCFIPMKCRASLSMVVDDIVHRALPGSPIGFVLQVWSFLW